jgi:hypothetical protein
LDIVQIRKFLNGYAEILFDSQSDQRLLPNCVKPSGGNIKGALLDRDRGQVDAAKCRELF